MDAQGLFMIRKQLYSSKITFDLNSPSNLISINFFAFQVESAMKSSVNDIILGALESIGTPTRAEWAQDWPCQGVLVAELINATNLIHEGYAYT